mgnify:CR=1 FL=1
MKKVEIKKQKRAICKKKISMVFSEKNWRNTHERCAQRKTRRRKNYPLNI